MIGLETTVSIGKQTNATLPTTLARQSLNVYSISGGQTEDDEDDNILGAGNTNLEDPVLPAPGLDDHEIQVTVPICNNQFSFWLAAYFGTETVSGTTPNYTHTWSSGQALPYIFLEHQLKSGRLRRHYSMIGKSMEIDLDSERGGYGQAKFTFAGIGTLSPTAALTGTVTAPPALDRPAQKLVNVTYNSVAGGDLMGGKFTHTRNLKRLRAADGTGVPVAVELDAISQITGSIRSRFHDDTFYDDGVAKTARALGIYLMTAGSAVRGVKFDFAAARLQRANVSVDGPGGIEFNPDFKAWQTSSAAALVAKVLNGTATAVLP